MKNLIIFGSFAIVLVACPSTKQTAKSDLEFRAALEESSKNKGQKPDFLEDEVLPNEQVTPADTAVGSVAVMTTPAYKEVRPSGHAKYRIQVFAGSAENAKKNFDKLSSDTTHRDVSMIHDEDDKWKVWVGAYETHQEATAAKQRFIEAGYPDAWVNEMKFVKLPLGLFWVQVGSFSNEAAADALKTDLVAKLKVNGRLEKSDTAVKVWLGGMDSRADAEKLKEQLRAGGYPKAFIVESK